MAEEVYRIGLMSQEVQDLLNPQLAKTNTCHHCGIVKLRSLYCDCPRGEAAWRILSKPPLPEDKK
jgi:hypothetical protein